MTDTTLTALPVRQYLRRLERGLHLMPAQERAAIIAEIGSHIADRRNEPGAEIGEILDSLGDATELARSYIEQFQLEDALARSANGSLLLTILERAARSAVALTIGCAVILIYASGLSLAAIAVLKPVFPHTVGLWWNAKVFAFGAFDTAPGGGNELLGYWIIPLSVLLAVLCYLAGTALARFGGRRLLSRDKALPAA